jgi:DNA invertase Pin-like site-specific DNA recombinase
MTWQTETIAVYAYASRSKDEEPGKDSTGDQLAAIRARIEQLGGRSILHEYADHASGFKGNRGPELENAIRDATEAVARGRRVELWVWKSERLGRGTGLRGEARALGGLLYELRAAGVAVRSVEDDEFATNEMMWGVASKMAVEYSQGLSANVKRGIGAKRARGEWRGGLMPGGYEAERQVDERGRVTTKVVKHSEDRGIFDLIWRLAEQGHSLQAIELELDRRGARTRPVRRDHSPVPFTVNRLSQTLDNPFYAGLSEVDGELVEGMWPSYVEPEVFWRLKAERAERSHATKRKPGRPVDYLLSERAWCGVCGNRMRVETGRKSKDGRRARRYVCLGHSDHNRNSGHWCPVKPLDADAVEPIVLDGFGAIFENEAALREQMRAGRRLELDRLGKDAHEAGEQAQAANRDAERADQLLADGIAADEFERAALIAAAGIKRREAEQAQRRMNAALDALSVAQGEPEDDADDAIGRLYEALHGQIQAARGDVKALNLVLREWFTKFEVYDGDDGLAVQPFLSEHAARHIAEGKDRENVGKALGVSPAELFHAAEAGISTMPSWNPSSPTPSGAVQESRARRRRCEFAAG